MSLDLCPASLVQNLNVEISDIPRTFVPRPQVLPRDTAIWLET